MATRKTEAKIVVSVEDQGSAVLSRIQARFDAMSAPLKRMQASLARPMQLAGVGRLAGSLGHLKNTMQGVPIAGSLFAAGGMALATNALIDNSVAAHDALGKLNDLSKAYKVSTKDLQVYAEVGADSGVVVEDIAKGMGFLQQKIAGARSGDKADLKLLASVGIQPADLKGDAASVFNKVSEVFKGVTSSEGDALKIHAAKSILGKAGISLIPLLEEGGAKYAEVFAKMQDEGRFFGDAQVESADAVGDAWGASMRRIDGLRKTVGLAMSPMLEAITGSIDKLMTGSARSEIIETFKQLGQTIAQEAPKFIAQIPAIVSGIGSIFKTVRDIGSVIGWDKLVLGGILFIASPFIAATISMVGALGGVAVALGGVTARLAVMGGSAAMSAINGIRGIALAMRIMGMSAAVSWALALGPILLIGAALAGVAYLIYSNWGGIKAFFGGVWEGFTSAMAPVVAAFEPVIGVISSAASWVGSLFGATSQGQQGFASWASAGQVAGEVLAGVFKALLLPIMLVIDAIKLVAATASMIGGKGFNFDSSTAKLYGGAGGEAGAGGGLPQGQIAGGGAEVGGQLDIRITSDGKAQVERVESKNPNFNIDARAGEMYANRAL